MIRSLNEIYHGTLNEYINAFRDHVNRIIMQSSERTKTQTSEEEEKLRMQNANNAIDD